jgi:putative ABC transport system permease protein
MDQLLTDVRYAFRTWRRSPGFALAAIATLALGIGANSTIFSVVNATLLRPIAYPQPDRLMTVWKARVQSPADFNIVSMPNYKEWQRRSTSFASMAIFDSAGRGYNLTGVAEPEQVSGVRVTASFFDVLGVPPLLGRTFRPEEEEPGAGLLVVLSHGLWVRKYGADRAVVGRPIQIDGLPHTVVGVMPASFRFQFWSGVRELWVPARWTRGDYDEGSNSFLCIGRLKPGVTLAQARSEMDAIGRSMSKERQHADDVALTAVLEPMTEYSVRELRTVMLTMLGVVGFVLLIACVNVANLMLARAAARHREFAIRSAVGASRRRIVGQLLVESVLLGCAGGAAGLVIALWMTGLLVPMLPGNLTFIPLRPMDVLELDWHVVAFTAGVSILSGILFGMAPAVTTFRDGLAHPLKENARGSVGGRSQLRYALVAAEIALTLVTLAGAGVMIVSVARLLAVDPGLDPKNVLVMDMSLPQADLYYGPPDHAGFCQALEAQVGGVPGVVSVSGIAHLPVGGGSAGRSVGIEGQPDPGDERRPGAVYTVACPNVLRTLGIKLLAGRDFTQQDAVGRPAVELVNETMARQFWSNGDAVGKRFKIGGVNSDNPWLTVAGIYANVRQQGLDREPRPSFIRPYSQAGWPWMSIVTKTAAAPASFPGPVKKALAIVEPHQPVSDIRTMSQVVGDSISSRRFPMLLLTGFAALALVLAAVGIAGVVAYAVVQRTQEIGVRMALGAEARHVLQLVVGHSFWWTLAGVAAGIVASLGLLRMLQGLVYGVTPTDPLVLGIVSLLLFTIALLASYVPARRAASVNPIEALRVE